MNEPPVASRPQTTAAKQAARLSALFEAHSDRLYRLARRLAPHTDEALDLVQETFLKAARSPDSIPNGSTGEEAWLVRVLVNLQRDRWRKETVRRRFLRGQHVVQYPDPEREILIRTTVWRALDGLSPRRRAVVVMYELEGLSIASIASLLGIAAVTVRWHLSRGRRELARQLTLNPGDIDEHAQNPVAGGGPAPSGSSAR
jgi:RNA polymerase sigma-70 factor (ECF subfamily)